MIARLLPATIAPALLAGAAQAAGPADVPAFRREMASYFDALRKDDFAPPGFVVVVVHGGRTVLARAYGVRDVETRAPLTLHNPIYTGSSTKAYTGLLAAELDRRGIMPLSTTLKDIWPALALPGGLDPSAVSAARLLSHSAPISDSGLTFISNETGEWTVDTVPAHLAKYARPMTKPFQYSNFGPFLYSVMVEKRTGLRWRDALRRYVLRPLALNETSARLEDFGAGRIGRCNSVSASEPRWHKVAPKPTPLLNAAGGVYASGNDVAAFLKAFTSGGRSGHGRIPASSLVKTAAPLSNQNSDTWGFHRAQYGLGWDIATYNGRPMWLRAGVYSGCRAMFAIFPREKLGIGMLTLGDVAGNGFNASAVQQAFDAWTHAPDAQARAAARIAQFHQDSLKSAAELRKPARPGIAIDPALLNQYAGDYRSDRLGTMRVAVERGKLVGRLGLFELDLTPVGPDRFENQAGLELEVETVSFARSADGRITALNWGEREFPRVN